MENRRWYGSLKHEIISSSLDTLDRNQFTQSLLDQMQEFGIPSPKNINLFPDGLGAVTKASLNVSRFFHSFFGGRHYQSCERTEGYMDESASSIVGLQPVGNVAYTTATNPNGSGCNSYATQHFKSVQVAAAVHETTHYIDAKLGLINRVLYSLQKQHWPFDVETHHQNELTANIKERIADTSAAIYLMPNYGDDHNVRLLNNSIIDLRTSELNTTHFTSSSIVAGIEAFNKNPKKGMTIIESSQMATDIIVSQPNLMEELEAVGNARHERDYGSSASPAGSNDPKSNTLAAYAAKQMGQMSSLAQKRFCGQKPD